MPEVIDNEKVGNYIKTLLKEHNMTQDGLAEKLNISKSAVSQNLSGRSSFDLGNLVKIAEIFDVSLEALLLQKTRKDQESISEYERIVLKGLDALKEVNTNKLKEVDIYGKVLIEYIIEHNKVKQFDYLIERDIPLFNDYAPNTKTLYYKCILFMLQHDLKGIKRFITNYVINYGDFSVEDESYEALIIETFNQKKYVPLMETLIDMDVDTQEKILKLFPYNKTRNIMDESAWLSLCAKYHALHLLEAYMNVYQYHSDLLFVVRIFIRNDFLEGLNYYIEAMDTSSLQQGVLMSLNTDQALKELIIASDIELFKKFVNRALIDNVDDIIKFLIENNKDPYIHYLLETHHDEISYRQAGVYTVKQENHDLLKRLLPTLSVEEKNYLLSQTNQNDYQSLKMLFMSGGRFELQHYRLSTYKKINDWIAALLDEKGELDE